MRSILFACLVFAGTFVFTSKAKVNENDWDDLEKLLQQVDQVGERILEKEGNDDDADESILMTSKNRFEESDEPKATDGKSKNPCENHICGWGKECVASSDKTRPKCQCIRKCPDIPNSDANDRVCSNRNQTFESICHLYRERCLCKRDDPKCTDFSFKHLHLEYLGACKELQPCTDEHLEQFSIRMADWLFQVMRDLKKRKELHGEKWQQMISEAEHDDHLKHVYPVIWKYCDLDSKPHDKFVSHHELIPIIAPVMPMESCIKPFLKICDNDKNDQITLKEWGKCLGLKEEEITERC